ncbi:arsenate reductase (glutaredoxin) [Candidatus Woesearchaeota archaeon]|jgi:arsenate reductase (glutaredoxin)|nr:arsenate reductase (glutaredoxin) [Candidatus Woesearchaeota archaeon]MBT6044723.1 arsenate reductase (glutaredoxin) [Candidatus Woesearchaeota archaeon]
MITIYHNPKCSKSRQSLELVLAKAKDVKIIEYLKTPLTKEELRTILAKLNLHAKEIIRTKEIEFQEYQTKELSEEELINLIIKLPILLERPIIIEGNKAVIGRPPENVLKILK